MNSKQDKALKPRSARPRRKTADKNIDVSDIAPLTAEFFDTAVRNPFYRPVKRSTTVRIDADVLGWLKAQGPGYQTRINALLRKAMLDKSKTHSRK